MPLFHIVTALLWLFVLLRFLIPLPWNPGAMFVVALILLVGSQHHLLSRRLFGSTFSPEMPRLLGIIANVLFGTLLLLATFQSALDLLVLAGSLLTGTDLAPPLVARYMVGATALALAIFGVSQAVRVPPIKELEIALPNLPAEFDGYRMIQLTDLHLSRLFGAA